MISVLLALAAAAPAGDEARYLSCTELVKTVPEKAVEEANAWRIRGGGVLARQCLGLGYAALQRWAPAATAFEQAARDAEVAQDARRSDFWVQSGNAWLAGGDGVKARQAFDAALATGAVAPELRGEIHFDRARAAVLLGEIAAARADLDQGLALVPSDPFGWYLSSALALREGKLDRAKQDIGKGLELAPNDPDLLVQAGTVAGTPGDVDAARSFYEKAVRADPESAAGKSAAAALVANAAAPEAAAQN